MPEDAIEVAAGSAARSLVEMAEAYSGHDLPYEDIRQMQIEALNERLQDRIDRIRLVRMRAEEAGISEIKGLEDAVPLLLPHTAYKSYPESFLRKGNWAALTKWLSTVSTASLDEVKLEGVEDVDGWVERLAEHGHLISCSSGTTGNPALMLSSEWDANFAGRDGSDAIIWASGIAPDADRRFFSFGMVTATPRGRVMGTEMFKRFADPSKERFSFPVPPVTIGSVTSMIVLRKAVADGSATPAEIARYEAESARREKIIAEAFEASANAIIAAREDKLFITGMWPVLFPVTEAVRAKGYSGDDFHPENAIYQAGGLKRAKLPDNYREFTLETYNLHDPFIYHMYGMQELQTSMPRCRAGRYHVPPWLVCLPLDKDGEQLLPGVGQGSVEGRAAFFDLSMEGRWGGVISGDHIEVNFGRCECGAASPSIADNIYRYADIQGDDKITCSGTVDAYVRGMS